MLRISIDFNVDDSAKSMVAFLSRLAAYLETPIAEHATIDFGGCQYLGPDAAAVLAAIISKRRKLRDNLTILLPKHPPPLDGFCEFSGLKHLIDGTPRPDTTHTDCQIVPVTQFKTVKFTSSNPIVDLVRKNIDLDDDTEDYLRSSISEVFQNVADHSESDDGGWYTGRYLASRHEIRVAVVDLGIGILGSLQKRYTDATTAYLELPRVLSGYRSSMSHPRNRGLGLSNLALHVRRMHGSLWVLSNDAIVDLAGPTRDPVTKQLAFKFRGTAVCFSLNLARATT